MIRDYLRNSVYELALDELDDANKKHGRFFHSPHEAWAVTREEVKEAEVELKLLLDNIDTSDVRVRRDFPISTTTLTAMKDMAASMACEAIQCMAMCMKWINTIEEGEE